MEYTLDQWRLAAHHYLDAASNMQLDRLQRLAALGYTILCALLSMGFKAPSEEAERALRKDIVDLLRKDAERRGLQVGDEIWGILLEVGPVSPEEL